MKNLVYDIRAERAVSPRGCRVKDNSTKESNRSAASEGLSVYL